MENLNLGVAFLALGKLGSESFFFLERIKMFPREVLINVKARNFFPRHFYNIFLNFWKNREKTPVTQKAKSNL